MYSLTEYIADKLCEVTVKGLRDKQSTVNQLYPLYPERVKAVERKGGIRLADINGDVWHFKCHSGTKDGVWYDVHLKFKGLAGVITKGGKDVKLWKKGMSGIDLNKLSIYVMENAGVQIVCDCPSDLYSGFHYLRSQSSVDAKYTEPEERSPVKRNPGKYGIECKHLGVVMSAVPFYLGTLAKFLKANYGELIGKVEKSLLAKRVKK